MHGHGGGTIPCCASPQRQEFQPEARGLRDARRTSPSQRPLRAAWEIQATGTQRVRPCNGHLESALNTSSPHDSPHGADRTRHQRAPRRTSPTPRTACRCRVRRARCRRYCSSRPRLTRRRCAAGTPSRRARGRGSRGRWPATWTRPGPGSCRHASIELKPSRTCSLVSRSASKRFETNSTRHPTVCGRSRSTRGPHHVGHALLARERGAADLLALRGHLPALDELLDPAELGKHEVHSLVGQADRLADLGRRQRLAGCGGGVVFVGGRRADARPALSGRSRAVRTLRRTSSIAKPLETRPSIARLKRTPGACRTQVKWQPVVALGGGGELVVRHATDGYELSE